MNPKILTIIISAITSILTLIISIILKSIYNKKYHIFKLEMEHKYEQRKEIKNILSKNKIQLINCSEALNHRLWNFTENYKNKWHLRKGNYKEGCYYLNSFTYRMLSFFAWIRIIEKEMIYLDTTISTKEDLYFIKFLRIFPQLFCNVHLFKGFKYDNNIAEDHFFKNEFEVMADCFIDSNKGIIDYLMFEKKFTSYLSRSVDMFDFINGITPDEKRYRWDILHLFHLTLIGFMNSFGYDFQYTIKEKIKYISNNPRKSKLTNNYIELLKWIRLDNQKEMKKIIKIIKS